jgi:hypothetical protein
VFRAFFLGHYAVFSVLKKVNILIRQALQTKKGRYFP